MTKKSGKVLDLVSVLEMCRDSVEIAPGKELSLRPLSLDEMITLLVDNQPVFFRMYQAAQEAATKDMMNLAPLLVSAPDMVADIIALASDQEDIDAASAAIKKSMPGTVQLIALDKILKLSAPDPKNTFALLSEVMGLLQKLMQKQNEETQKTPSLTASSSQ